MISTVVLTKNEEENIGDCIKSLNFCDEVIVIDDYSIDKTKEIAKKLKAKIFERKLGVDFAAQRNFGLSKAKGDWVLFVDADERVAGALKEEILEKTKGKSMVAGYYLKRRDNLWGRDIKHGEIGNVRLLRLAQKGAGKWRRKVHEVWDVKGETKTLNYPLIHYPHQTVKEFISEIRKYSVVDTDEHIAEGKKSSVVKIIAWPFAKFVNNFILKLGFLDGVPGLLVALIMSFHSFTVWNSIWLKQKLSLVE